MRDVIVPVLFAIGIVLGQAAQVDGSAWVAVRPLVVAAVLGAACYLVAFVVTRTRGQAVAAIALYWRHIHRERIFSAEAVAAGSCGIAVILGLVGTIAFATSGPILAYAPASTVQAATAELPPIYLILLDGYPRRDMLNEYFGTDNSEFLAALDERGFDVYPDATSNQHFTALTLAINATPASGLGVSEVSRPAQYRALHELFNEGPVWDELRDAGYTIVTIPPTPDGPKPMTADVSLDEGHMTGFEVHLIESTALKPMFDFAGIDVINDQHRARIRAGFDALERAGGAGSFVWAHFFVPHRPVVFRADGSPRDAGAWEIDCTTAEFLPAFAEQVSFTSDRVLEAVDALPSGAPIVVFSDQGSREPPDADEWLRTLLVARTPDHPLLFGDDPQPLGWFPRLLNTHAEAKLPGLYGGHWRSHQLPMDIEPIEP